MWIFSKKRKNNQPKEDIESYIENGDYRQYIVHVAGISYNNEDGSSRRKIAFSCKYGDVLILERDINNKYDNNAVKILNNKHQQLGFLSSYDAKNVSPILKGTSRMYDRIECRFIESDYFDTEDNRRRPYCRISIRQYYKK